MARPGMPGLLAVLLLVAGAGVGDAARAQLPHLDPVPWHTPADSTSRLALVLDVQRMTDDHTGWEANRILLTAVLPAGESSTYFLRIPHQTFDTGGLSLHGRWPWALAPETDGRWPGEDRTSSFGQIEVGATGPWRIPGLGAADYAVAVGVPMGNDRVYPFASTGIPLRLAVRKPVPLGGRRLLHLAGGYLEHMGSGKDILADAAFPGGWMAEASFDWFRSVGGVGAFATASRTGTAAPPSWWGPNCGSHGRRGRPWAWGPPASSPGRWTGPPPGPSPCPGA